MKRLTLSAVALIGLLGQSALADDRLVWVEAEDFAEKGDWVVETQFTHKMGSAYLLCPGPDSPREHAATTSVSLPSAGTWTVWARTKDWLPEFSPGRFALVVNGRESAPLGASKRTGWTWEKAGVFKLPAGACALALKDLSGAYARCDAVLLTTDAGYVPPEEGTALAVERARLKGIDQTPEEMGEYDVVVVGAGPGGMGASLASARTGARTVVVFDRPIPGGNASREFGIPFSGAAIYTGAPHAKPDSRETGIVDEIRLTARGLNLWAVDRFDFTAAYERLADAETNLVRFANERVLKVEKQGRRITAVLSRNVLTGRWRRWRGRQFVDSTGDGWLGFYAGARMMFGREAGREYGETWVAPEVADKLTMSGTLGGPYCRKTDRPVEFRTPVWADIMPTNFCRGVDYVGRQWWLENPGRFNDIEDPEAARDHLIRINFAFFGWLKNTWAKRELARNYEFCFPKGFNGRREGMRIVGDYVLTANDCREGRIFPDRVMHGGWALDTHDPLGMDNPSGDGLWHPFWPVRNYSVPFRALYAADVDNLLMGSRCESMTHMALGSMRVQGTQATAGQVVGTAAALCVRYGIDPRALGRTRIGELQQRLLRDDVYIPELANADPSDLARTARASAPEVIDGYARAVGTNRHCWVSAPALPQSVTLDFPRSVRASEVRIAFDPDLTTPHPKGPQPGVLARNYFVELKTDEGWRTVVEEYDNYLGFRVHRFPAQAVRGVRVTVTATWGDPSARIFEIRVYGPDRSAVPVPAAPWKTVRTDGTTVSVWGRDYAFASNALPVSVRSAGDELLSAPIRLVADETGGRQVVWRDGGSWVERADGAAATVCAWQRSENVTVDAVARVEPDGMMKVTMTLSPGPEQGTQTFSRVWLEIPLRPEFATLRVTSPSTWGRADNAGGVHGPVAWPFKPSVWLGNEEKGLCWFCESDEGFRPADGNRVVEVLPGERETVLRIRLLENGAKVVLPAVWTFGLQATPVKPFDRSWSENFIYHMVGETKADGTREKVWKTLAKDDPVGRLMVPVERAKAAGAKAVVFHEDWVRIQNDPSYQPAFKSVVDACQARGIKVLVYLGFELSPLDPEWPRWQGEALRRDASGEASGWWYREPAQHDYMLCYASGYSKAWLERAKRAYLELGINGYFLDGTIIPQGCANVRHGCGWTDAAGGRHESYPIFAVREMMRELYEFVDAHGGVVNAHQSGYVCPATLSFCHAYWDGEQIAYNQDDIRGHLDLEVFRAEFMGVNHGVPCEFLSAEKPGLWTHEDALAVSLLHNVLPRANGPSALRHFPDVWKTLGGFGIATADFHPYWRNGLTVTPSCVKASYWEKDGARLVVVSNLSDKPVTADVRWPAGEKSGEIRVSLAPFRCQLVRVDGI